MAFWSREYSITCDYFPLLSFCCCFFIFGIPKHSDGRTMSIKSKVKTSQKREKERGHAAIDRETHRDRKDAEKGRAGGGVEREKERERESPFILKCSLCIINAWLFLSPLCSKDRIV